MVSSREFSLLFHLRAIRLRRVSGSSGRFNGRYRMSCNLSCCFYNFSYGEADTVTKIEYIAFSAVHQIFYGKYMCVSQVRYMYIIPYACAVLRRIIRSKILICSLSVRYLQDKRYKVAFGIMSFSYRSALVCSACVKNISKKHILFHELPMST